ncbi:glycosyl transferase [Gammaproteobacteria bacterium]|jgi:hypothetical protein|nr:glycosyl transferase [Gammaproteobacteria bacterium]
MHNYCTLFDSKYLTRGLALHESLIKQSSNFHLFIFAFDNLCFEMLIKLKLDNVTVISLKEFEDDELLELKDSRNPAEYCWTCTPSTIKYCIDTYKLDSCTYLDADIYFFGDPSILIKEMEEKSILITEHRYTPKYDQASTSGIYCVQFMTFKNNAEGIEALNWWRSACNEWCFSRCEDGKFGDQKYLDDWTVRFQGVHVLQHLGGGVAPWNVQQYDLLDKNFNLIFYHFHNFKLLNNSKLDMGSYELDHNDIMVLYKPYSRHLNEITERLKIIDPDSDYNGIVHFKELNWKNIIKRLLRMVRGNYNIVHSRDFL